MKKTILWGVTFILTASVICLGFFEVGFQKENEKEVAMAKAQAMTAQIIDQAYKAYFTGNLTEFKEFLDERDSGRVVRGLLEKSGIDIDTPRIRILSGLGLPPFDDPGFFDDGYVLLSGTKGSIISWVIPGYYTHSGVLDQELYTGDDAGCVITANLDGVTYETYNDWNAGSWADKIVTSMKVNKNISQWRMNWAQKSIMRWYQGWTIYSFLKLNLDPISRWDPWRWYCAKTVWRVFKKAGVNLENANYYIEIPGMIEFIKEHSGLFQLYYRFLVGLGFSETEAQAKATEKLVNALDECITPDEIRFDDNLIEVCSWGTPIFSSI